MRGTRAKRLRQAIGYDMQIERHPNHEFSRQYGVGAKGNTVCTGLRAHYRYIKERYKRNHSWLRTV